MEVRIIEFPDTPVAAVEHLGAPEREYEASQRLIRWRIRHGISPLSAQTYGVHYTNPFGVSADQHRVDFCVSFSRAVLPNAEGVVAKVIPRLRCAVTRHLGSRKINTAAQYLGQVWLPQSGEVLGDFPIFFHYINVGPSIQEHEMVTDVYLPLGPVAEA
jgi:AraC family transcriptional regulator